MSEQNAPSPSAEPPAAGSVPSALLHTEVKSFGGHKVEFHVLERQSADVLELVSYDCEAREEYPRSYFTKSTVRHEVEDAAQALLAIRVGEMQIIRASLPADTDFKEQDDMILADLRNKLAGEYIIARVAVDFKSEVSPGGIRVTMLEGDVTALGDALDIKAEKPEGDCDFEITRKMQDEPSEKETKSVKSTVSTKSTKERRRRHTIKDVMANHAMEVIGGILGLPSRDAADSDAPKSTKSKSGRHRRHTTESDPSNKRRASHGGGSRRSSKDAGRPPSGSAKYDLDATAGVSVKKRRGSVKASMIASTKEAVSSAVEGVKNLIVSPRVAPEVDVGAHAQPTPPETAPVVDAVVVSASSAHAEADHNSSANSLISPKEAVTQAVPVDSSAPTA